MERVPRLENCKADNLAKMASFGATQSVGPINADYISIPSVNLPEPGEVRAITTRVP